VTPRCQKARIQALHSLTAVRRALLPTRGACLLLLRIWTRSSPIQSELNPTAFAIPPSLCWKWFHTQLIGLGRRRFQIRTIWFARSIPRHWIQRFSALRTLLSIQPRSSFERFPTPRETLRDPISTALAREPRTLSSHPVALEVLSSPCYDRSIATKPHFQSLIFSQSRRINLTRQFSLPQPQHLIHSQTSHE